MGLGLLGRGVGDAEFLATLGADVLVTDLKSESELSDSITRLSKFTNIEFVLGEHRLQDFVGRDMIFKSAGVPFDSPYIAHARKYGVPIVMSTALLARFARDCGATVVGITGTRGKSTITHMIGHCLVTAKHDSQVHIGGNIRGVSTLSLLPNIKSGDIVVLELDSWQLQGFAEEQLSPHIAVFSNFYQDHMNYYRSMDEYFRDKANIFKFQKEADGDILIIGKQALERIKEANPPVKSIVAIPIPESWQLKVLGVHNRENASLAREALAALKVPDAEIREGLESFTGIEGRLEFIGTTKQGVDIYNDNNATTPEATLAALEALNIKGNLILIAGGTDKGADPSEVARKINEKCASVHLYAGSGTEIIVPLLDNATVYESFADTVKSVVALAGSGDTILFSPIFSSFGKEFINEYDRNDRFKALASKYLA